MLEGLSGDSRKWGTGALESPLGRGVNFQWDVTSVDLWNDLSSITHLGLYVLTSAAIWFDRPNRCVDSQWLKL